MVSHERRMYPLQRTINATLDPDVAVLIMSCAITSVEDTGVGLRKRERRSVRFSITEAHKKREKANLHVRIQVPGVVLVDGTRN